MPVLKKKKTANKTRSRIRTRKVDAGQYVILSERDLPALSPPSQPRRPPWLEVLEDGSRILDFDEMAAEDDAELPELERRIARLSRRTARFVRELRDDGEHAIAEWFVQFAAELVEQLRNPGRRVA